MKTTWHEVAYETISPVPLSLGTKPQLRDLRLRVSAVQRDRIQRRRASRFGARVDIRDLAHR